MSTQVIAPVAPTAREGWTYQPCRACGHEILVKLDTRQKPPVVSSAKKWRMAICTKPDPAFEVRVRDMSQAEIEAACSAYWFWDEYQRLLCWEARQQRRGVAESAMTDPLSPGYILPQPNQPSADTDRYGPTVEVETLEGTQDIDLETAAGVHDPEQDRDKANDDQPKSEDEAKSEDAEDKEEEDKEEEEKEDEPEEKDEASGEAVESDLEKIAEVQQAEAEDDEDSGTKVEAPAPTAVDRPKRLSGPGRMSPTFPAIPVFKNGELDPHAPFGRDENDRPIIPPVSDAERVAHLGKRPDLAPGACPHKNDPAHCIICGTTTIRPLETVIKPEPATPEQLRARERKILEDNVRKQFFPPEDRLIHLKPTPPPPWRRILPNGHGEIIEPTSEERQAYEDQCRAVSDYNRKLIAEARRLYDPNAEWIPLQKVFWWWPYFRRSTTEQILVWLDCSDPDLTGIEIRDREYRQELIEPDTLRYERAEALAKVQEQKRERQKLQQEHDGFSAKLRPDLDAKTRAWYKRKAKVAMKVCDSVIDVETKRAQRLWKQIQRWPDDPKHYRRVSIPGTGTEVIVQGPTLREILTEPLAGRAPISKADLDRYIAASDPLHEKYKGFIPFESKLIYEIMKTGFISCTQSAVICCPLPSVLEVCPWLAPEVPLDHAHDETENELIIKTGGAQIGGRVVGGGTRLNKEGRVVSRPLNTFENSDRAGTVSPGSGDTGDNDSWGGDIDSGDSE